jgi:hypothetical protein
MREVWDPESQVWRNLEAFMRIGAAGVAVLVLIILMGPVSLAQGRHELAFAAGGGTLIVKPDGGGTPVFSLSYQFHFTKHLSAEGAFDIFYYKFLTGPAGQQYVYRDDYAGAEAAFVYHFWGNRDAGRWLPFVAAGIGKTTTDFTEIPATLYYRFGAGVSYHMTRSLGLRFEIRDERITGLWQSGSPKAHLPSGRVGIVLRF